MVISIRMFLWKYPTFFNVCSNFGSLDESHLERRKATCHFKTSKPKLENKVEVSHPPQSLVVLGMQTTLWERAGVDSCKDEGELGGQPLKYSLCDSCSKDRVSLVACCSWKWVLIPLFWYSTWVSPWYEQAKCGFQVDLCLFSPHLCSQLLSYRAVCTN